MTGVSSPPPPPQDPPAPRDRRRLWLLAIALATVAAGLWLAFRSPDDLIQGMADADNVNISAKITARVRALHVHEGDRVTAGQPMFELDSPEVVAKQQQATSALEAASALADKAREGARREEVRAAQAQWQRTTASARYAQSTFERLDNLFAQGVVTRQRRDEAQAQALSAAAQQDAARAQYDEALAGARRQDQEAAFAQVRQAQGAVAEMRASGIEVTGRAPVDGEVGKRLADTGELIPAGYPIFSIVDIDHMWVSLNLREDQFGGVAIGDTLHGQIPALALQDVAFKVYYIAPAGDYATWRATRQSSGYDVKSFEVRVRPVAPVPRFRPGMSVLFAWPQR